MHLIGDTDASPRAVRDERAALLLAFHQDTDLHWLMIQVNRDGSTLHRTSTVASGVPPDRLSPLQLGFLTDFARLASDLPGLLTTTDLDAEIGRASCRERV